MTDNYRLSPSSEKQQQNAFRFSLAMAISMSLISAILVLTSGMPKGLLDLTALAIIVAFCSVFSVVLSRQGQHVTGIILLISSLLLACIVTAVLFSGFGPVLAIVALMISFGAGTSSLPRKYANVINTISVVLALCFILLDIFEPIQREVNTEPILTWAMAGVLGVVFGIGILRNFSEYNFRTKLIISFIFMSVVTLGILAIFNQNSTSKILTTNLGRELEGIAATRGNRIGNLLNEQINALTVLAINKAVQDDINFSNQLYTGDESSILAEIDELDQQWRAADAANNNLDELVYNKLTNQTAQELRAFQRTFPDNAEIFATDEYGAVTGITNRTSDYYQADEEWWQAAYNNGDGAVYVSDPEYDESLGKFSVLIAIPVVDKDTNKVIGVLRTTYLLDALATVLLEPIGNTGEADMYIPGVFPITAPFYLHGGGYGPVDQGIYDQLIEFSDQPYVEIYYEGYESIVSQSPVTTLGTNPIIDDLGWFVVIHQHADEVLGPIKAQTRTALGLVIVIVGVAAAIAVGLAQVLVSPITRLTSTAQEVAAGDLSIQAEVTTRDEVGTLAITFNEMTIQLRNILAGLEDRITARTRDLELAAEIGRRLSVVSDTEEMLTEAVNTIQERFDLYYTQVYLTDPTGRSLVLQAGTGEVGQTLLRRNHRLPLDLSSLNGITATERRTIVVEDTATSPIHRPNPLLPNTRSEMAVPLIVGDRVVGVLDMQSAQPGVLNSENQPAFEALAGSLAIAVANATLFERAENARIRVEEQARRLTTSGWQSFLDAIERSERLAFTYDRQTISALPDVISSSSDKDLVTPIQVSGATVGKFRFERERAWTEGDQTIVNSVSQQVAQQIENLRLLAQAQQYQAAAQEALRQITREGWDQYKKTFKDQQVGFIYSDHEVKPWVEEATAEPKEKLSYPISVRNETIGHVDVLGVEDLSEDDAKLVAFITEQLSEHIENLRLSKQTQVALAETEDQSERLAALNELSEQLNNTENLDEILNTSARYLDRIVPATRTSTAWPTTDGTALEVIALQGEAGAIPTGTKLPIEGTATGAAFKERRVIRIPDLAQSNFLENTRLGEQGLRSTMAVPLLTTDRVLGTLNFGSQNLDAFDNRHRDLAIQAASLISGVIENQELFAQTQSALAQTEILYEIGRKLNQANNEAEILASVSDTAARIGCKQTSLMYFERDEQGQPEWLTIVAAWSQNSNQASPVGNRFSVSGFPLMAILLDSPDNPVLVSDVAHAENIDETLRGIWLNSGFQAMGVVPLGQAGQWQGLITFSWDEPHEFSNQEESIFDALISLITPAVQSRRLFKQAQNRAKREQAMSQITTAVRGSTDMATILQTAVREIGTTLGRKAIIRFGNQDQNTKSDNGKDDTQPA